MAQQSGRPTPFSDQPGDVVAYGRTTYDIVNDVLVPLCLVGMLWCLARFLFDVRAVFASGDAAVMRYVLFWFLIAVVGIAKIEALRGGKTISLPYKIGLGIATLLFILRVSAADALFGEGSGGQGLAFLINAITYAAIYWGGTAITRDCTVNEETEDQAEAALMGQRDPIEGDVHQRVRPGRSVFRFSLLALALFAFGQLALAKGSEQAYHAAFYSVTGYILFAFLVLALTNFSGLRLYLVGKKLTPPPSMLPMWVAATLVLVALIIGAALIIPRRDLKGEETVVARGMRASSGQHSMDAAPTSGTADAEGASSALSRDKEQEQGAQGREGGGQQGDAENAGDNGGDSGDASGSGGNSQGGQDGQGGGGDQQGQGEGDGQGEGQGQDTQQPPPPPPHSPVPEGVSQVIFWVLVGLAALAILWAIIRSRRGVLDLLRALLTFPKLLLDALRMLLSRLGRRPSGAGSGQSAGPRRRIPTYVNPFARSGGADMPPSELILYSYQALMALAERLGTPRRDDQTALEFARELPSRLQPLKDEVRDLSRMYIEVEYAPEADLSAHLDRLRQIWVRLDSVSTAAGQ